MITNQLPTAAALFMALFCACATQSGAQDTIVEPTLPTTRGGQGYFPTLGESALLRGAYNARSPQGAALGNAEGPDAGMQTASGLFPYEDSDPDFYQRNQNFFRPLNQTLGWLTPHDAWTMQFSQMDNNSLTVDGNLGGIFTRSFAPELATVKAGPLYFDLLWVGAGAIWSDYNGNLNTTGNRGDEGDGVIAYVDVGVRGVLRISDSLYLSAVADLMYLPFTNRFALQFGGGGGGPALFTRLNYSKTLGSWDVLFYDEFIGQSSLNWFSSATVNGYDRAGRYFYGFQTPGPTNSFQNSGYARFGNTIGMSLSTLVFDNSWRLWITGRHVDFWQGYEFRNHANLENIGVALGYEGSKIPFAPRFSYDMYAYGGSDSVMHQFLLSLTGRLTENLNWLGSVGDFFMTGAGARGSSGNRFIWNIDLRHSLTQNTTQSFGLGETVFHNNVVGEALLSRYAQYSINQRLNSRSYGNAFIQYADSETNLLTMQTARRTSVGVAFNYQPLDFTQLNASIIYDKFSQSTLTGDRWRYMVTATQQLGMRLTGSLFYQYEDYQVDNPARFSEHLIGVTIRRYF
ncbi:hypothetical protein [Prosthecobacter sp.]|uniref:hypothetical protein n=1 Tax=Prosthecobacter sp. TaxID=1965333 RepID=UPI002488DD86|nr:hypothetical protein [Prosthecobacter sp.]MDI1310841.1 hypothetical protein [Prosthecobacter sp.]